MTESETPEISGTAFVVNYSRSRMVSVSSDIYANIWVTPEAISLWNTFAQEVYPHDDLNISLRNRFYLDHVQDFAGNHPQSVCINMGAGFTSYPFLSDGSCRFLEIDYPHIISYKAKAVLQWVSEGQLPSREVTYLPADLNSEKDLEDLQERLTAEIDRKPSVVILEGITYYLEINNLKRIFSILNTIQTPGSQILLDFWPPDSMDYPIMKRLKTFMDRNFGYLDKTYTLFDDTFIQQMTGYTAIEITDSAHLERQYTSSKIFQDKGLKIPVRYAILQRK